MPTFLPQSRPEWSRNAMLDFSGLNAGIDAGQRNALMQGNQDLQREELGMSRERLDMQKQQFGANQQKQITAKFGALAQAVDAETDPAKRAASWQRVISMHPGAKTLDRVYLDPVQGPKLLMAESGNFRDPLETRLKEAQINNLNQKNQPDPIENMLMERLRRRSAPGAAPAPQGVVPQQPGSNVRPQSNQEQGADPMLQLASDEQGASEQPQAAQPQPAAPDMIETPYGSMSREEATDLGAAMLLSPKPGLQAAGKAILDAAQVESNASLTKPTVNQLQERTLNSATQLARIGDIKAKFKPEFLEIPNRLKMLGLSWSAKLGPEIGGKLSPENRKSLERYASFRSSSVNNLNTILKEMSGAAVTPQEYERIQNDQPVAGTGILDGDDPVSFMAKLERTESTLKAAIARYNFMRSKGLNFDKNSLDQFMSLEDVPAAIDKRGDEIMNMIRQRNPQADPQSLQNEVGKQLKREFGI